MDIKLLELFVAIIGSVFVVWYWNGKKQRLEQFRYVDEAYIKLLERYFQHPEFGDPALTRDYAKSFVEQEGLKYRYFAMAVHTVMETLFDLYEPKIPKWLDAMIPNWCKSGIPDEWIQIFNYHTTLHMSWLTDNRQLHEPAYVEYVLKIAGTKGHAL